MKKIGRNDPCPCGSGKKHKQCCLPREKLLGARRRSEMASAALQISQTLQAAQEHHRAGRLPQAETLCKQILQVKPDHPDTLQLLGMIAHQHGKSNMAVELINKAIRANPTNAIYFNNLGVVYRALGRLDEAIACYRKALMSKPDYAEAYNNLGNTLNDQGKLGDAIVFYHKALTIKPDYADAYYNLGHALNSQGKLDEAIVCYQKVLSINPYSAEAHNNMGAILNDQGKLDEAIDCYQKALSINPYYAEAHNNMGATLNGQGKLDEAIDCYQKALSINPYYAEAYHNLGIIRNGQGRQDEAIVCYQKVLSINPYHAEVHNNMGATLNGQGKLDEAIDCYQKALAINPDFANAYNNLGNALKDQCKLDEAIDCYQKALAIKPDYAEVFSSKLLVAHYTSKYSSSELFAEHLNFAEQVEAPLRHSWRPYPNIRDPERRLKVGYVSPDFCAHSVAYFIEPILANHDKSQVEVFCYYSNNQHDSFTDRVISEVDHWIPCKTMADDQLADRIRSDGIDILVDLSGHTANNRLPVFARKPAPVQVTYLGYINTTGLSAMDYRLTHIDADPPANNAYYSETLFRLSGNLWWCYRPQAGMPEVAPPPVLANGFVTFGSTNNFAKLSPETIALWADLLRVLPDSRLIIAGVPQGVAQKSIYERFVSHGIDVHRLTVHGKLPLIQFWELHHQIDIALDPFPYNGGTTTCDALWLGVPLVALTGQTFVSRMGYALLKNIGLSEFAAESEQEYVNIAVGLASDTERLEALRAGMRERLFNSPLCDEAGFTGNLERAYREMWGKWCNE